MSAPTVYHQLESSAPGLREKIAQNEELASVVMGLLIQLIRICELERAKPVTGMTFSQWTANGDEFTAKFFTNSISLALNHTWGPRREFADYVGQKSSKIALALHDNPKMEVFFQELVEAIDQYSRHKGIPFDELMFEKHFITMQDLIVLSVKRRSKIELAD